MAAAGGVCMMNINWKEQHPSFVHFISSFLSANSYRLNFLPIAPDFIFNNGGVSIAFVFVTSLGFDGISPIFSRIQKLKSQFCHFYMIVTVPNREANDSFVRSYFKALQLVVIVNFGGRNGVEVGSPTFFPVRDLEMGFEKMVKIAHLHGVLKKQDGVSKLKSVRKMSVQKMEKFTKVITSVPGIDNHDANMLFQAIGSIEAVSRASKNYIIENTDLSPDKAETIVKFFNDPMFFLDPKIDRKGMTL